MAYARGQRSFVRYPGGIEYTRYFTHWFNWAEKPRDSAAGGGSICRMTDERSERSFLPLTHEHLSRLAYFAEVDHQQFRQKHPEWAADLLACCLVQGGARHYVRGDRGVKDLDVYLLYTLPAGRNGGQFPWNRGANTRNRDFGVSELGRQLYTAADRADPKIARKIPAWERYSGRRVDLLSRAIPAHDDGPRAAVEAWLKGATGESTPWDLRRVPVICLYPEFGELWWTGPDLDEPGIEKGVYG
ncbi:hypothetical protein OG225_41015 (plasmid) [Nocardia sp. NBC_01377]|uniref:hypothetical protein n=1 Tax=Nocardia sp. NBC_01377 TaxID=2903595 RepID=UPI00324EDB26